DGRAVVPLGEGEGERGAGVPGGRADGRGEVLAAVEVAEGEVVDAAEHARGDGVDAADGQVALGVARFAAGDEGVGEHDGAGTGMLGGALADAVQGGAGDGLVAAGEGFVTGVSELGASAVWLEIGQSEEEDLAVLVLDADGVLDAGNGGEEVDAAAQEGAAEAEAFRGVMVPAGQDD